MQDKYCAIGMIQAPGTAVRKKRQVILILAAVLVWMMPLRAGAYAHRYLNKSDEWFRSEEGNRVLTNVLSWQSLRGSWPRNTNTTAKPYQGPPDKINGTFDNYATVDELRLLGKAYNITGEEKYNQAFRRGLDHILTAQYPSGGWPQYFPPGKHYNRYITFNDDAMIRLMYFVREVATSDTYKFTEAKRRKKAQRAYERGLDCILKCQIRIKGKLTVWCAQHDEKTYEPRHGRRFELVSLSGAESAHILAFLMSIENPSPEIVQAIHAGAQWFESAKLTGVRWAKIGKDRKLVKDASAPPLWARFYEIGTNRPIFADNKSVKKYDVAEISQERRINYAWYGPWGAGVADRYEKWKQDQAAPNEILY